MSQSNGTHSLGYGTDICDHSQRETSVLHLNITAKTVKQPELGQSALGLPTGLGCSQWLSEDGGRSLPMHCCKLRYQSIVYDVTSTKTRVNISGERDCVACASQNVQPGENVLG
jgi:hypothetical protein